MLVAALLYHNLTSSNFYILKGECRKCQSVSDKFHKLWMILENSAKILSCHCTRMADMGEICNHVVDGMFRVEAVLCFKVAYRVPVVYLK